MQYALDAISGVARAFPGWRIAHPKSQTQEEIEQSVRKNKKNYRDLRKNEESGTLTHPGLWGWLQPWIMQSCVLNVPSACVCCKCVHFIQHTLDNICQSCILNIFADFPDVRVKKSKILFIRWWHFITATSAINVVHGMIALFLLCTRIFTLSPGLAQPLYSKESMGLLW